MTLTNQIRQALDEFPEDKALDVIRLLLAAPPPTVTDKPRFGAIPIGNFKTPDGRAATIYRADPPKPLTPEQMRQIDAEKQTLNAITHGITSRTRKGVHE